MVSKEFTFPSFNGVSRIFAWKALPDCPPVGIVQIVHGLGCHSGRYHAMVRRLCQAGFIVCADDHVGHGRTAAADGTFGYSGNRGYKTFLEDEHALRTVMREEYPELPFVMFGHSMGSMISRLYAAVYPQDDLRALVLCGVCEQNKGAEEMQNYPGAAEQIAAGKGADMQLAEPYGAVLMEYANDRFPGESPLAWISQDPGVQEDYINDPYNNHVGNSLQMLYDFAQLYRHSISEENNLAIPRELPILLLAGDQDPCGNYGEGVYHAANALIETGHRVSVLIYCGHRHEVHNHPEIREDVFTQITAFFKEALDLEA